MDGMKGPYFLYLIIDMQSFSWLTTDGSYTLH